MNEENKLMAGREKGKIFLPNEEKLMKQSVL